MTEEQAFEGGCLCGAIRYRSTASPVRGVICHCSMCRKSHGAAFRTRASVNASNFKFLSGENLLTYYESSPGERRSFCNVCGSNIITKFYQQPNTYGFALGTLDTDPDVRIERHIFTKYKAPWYEITDDLPQTEDMNNSELEKLKYEKKRY